LVADVLEGDDLACGLVPGGEPELEVGRQRHQAAAGGLGLGGLDLDEAPGEVDLAPIQAEQFGVAQSGKGAQRQKGQQVVGGVGQQLGELGRGEDC
jgi:hypothetical protein